MKVFFATKNKHKFQEAHEILAGYAIQLEQLQLDYPEIQSGNLEEIAVEGVGYVLAKVHKPTLIEDTGLFIKALNGFPGPFSAFVHKTIGNKGILKLLEGEKDREAYFMSVVAYAEQEENVETFIGVAEGKIAGKKRGRYGFGYDPIFLAEGANRTFGEMKPTEKNQISHRRKAFDKFAEWYQG